jgi:hypothetical protein
LDKGGAISLFAATLPAKIILLLCFEIIVGHIVVNQFCVAVILRDNLFVQMLLKSIANLVEMGECAVNIGQVEVEFIKE